MRVELDQALDAILESPGVVFLLGDIDSGKTTVGFELLQAAVRAGIPSALVDADIAQTTVGPPTTVGLKLLPDEHSLSSPLAEADRLGFVGALSPRGHLLPHVANSAKLVDAARSGGAKLVVLDTTGLVSGIYGQTLKFHKMDLVQPDYVLALSRGGELDPVVGIAHRFTNAQVFEVESPAQVRERSAEERMAHREKKLASYFARGSSRWKVKPTVFMPTLPSEFDLSLLEGLVVGMEDGSGQCVGIGALEYDPDEEILRMVSPVTEGVRGLRLGSVKIDTAGRFNGVVNLSQLFRSE
ncbi:MAG TPA: Clp1/GlmU family protein [Actinomycetota bacterium]|nr:Clp1/GlmU family protein [Actinomycetota bacterium]